MDMSCTEVNQLLQAFGINGGTVTPLKGHNDLNYLVVDGQEKYVFKMKSLDEDEMEAQLHFMVYLGSKGFSTPHLIHTVDGHMFHSDRSTRSNMLTCLLTFMDGMELYDIDRKDLTDDMLYEVGQLLGDIHAATQEMNEDIEAKIAPFLDCSTEWNMENASKWKQYIPLLEDEFQLTAKEVTDTFLSFMPSLEGLKKGVLHADFHDSNVILHNPTTKDIKKKYAIIDFGDITISYYVFDLVISMSYFMMLFSTENNYFIEQGAHLLAGYLSKKELDEIEVTALYISLCAAYCRELILCTKDYLKEGGRNEYLRTSLKGGWPQVTRLWRQEGRSDFTSTCNRILQKHAATSKITMPLI